MEPPYREQRTAYLGRDSLEVVLLGLLEVDDVPDGLEVLHRRREHSRYTKNEEQAGDLRRP